MALYTVKSGDNLTKIAQQYGIGIENITGYRSGNPNLIYPGETLTINTQPVAPVQPSPQPVQQSQPPQNAPGSPTPQVTPTPVAQLSPTPQPAPQPIQQQVQQPTQGPGSVAETNRLLGVASAQTGVPAPTFAPSGAVATPAPQATPVPIPAPAPTPTPTPAPVKTLTTEELIQQYLAREDAQISPSATFEDIYNKVSEKLNLASDKAGIESSAKEIEKLKIELGDKISEINANPWISEGLRSKKVSQIQEKYQAREDALINRLRLQESVYNRNAENARFAATQAFDYVQQQQTGERQQAQLEQNQFQFLIEQAQKAQEAQRKLLEPKTTTGIVGEYTFYVDQEKAAGRKPVSFNEYQNIDANRKKSIAAAGVSGLTPYQESSVFNRIVDKYNASPLVQAADRTPVLKGAIVQIKKNPKDAASQLSLVYAYIQALDTYQSAVREGELSLVNSIDSKVGQLKGSVQKIQNGQIVRPEVALQIAANAELIVNTISKSAEQKAKAFQSQAEVSGIGSQFKQYTGGFTPSYKQPESQKVLSEGKTSSGLKFKIIQ